MALDVLCYTMLDLRWFIQNMGFCPLWLISLAQTSHQLMHWSKFLVAILVFFQSGLKIHKLCICLNSYFVFHMHVLSRKNFYIRFSSIFYNIVPKKIRNYTVVCLCEQSSLWCKLGIYIPIYVYCIYIGIFFYNFSEDPLL